MVTTRKFLNISPCLLYRYDQYSDGWDTAITIKVCGENVRFFHTKKKGVDRVFVDHPSFLAKVGDCSNGMISVMFTLHSHHRL